MSTVEQLDEPAGTEQETGRGARTVSRRALLGFLVAAPTLTVAARASASIISPPEISDIRDLGDLQVMAAMPTANLITIVINKDSTVSFAMPRCEVGQGLTTSIGMLIADELDVSLSKVKVTLADARPELGDNQLTGGSNSMRSLYNPVRTAAAIARLQLLTTAAKQMGVPARTLTVKDGVITAPHGGTRTFGSLAEAAAVTKSRAVRPRLKAAKDFAVIGTSQNRVDAHDIVTGKKVFTMDLDIPGALPTMVCRPPTIGGTVRTINNRSAVLAMPGVTHVAAIPNGVAVRARTFGQCIDAVRALNVTWGPGTEDGRDETAIAAELKKAELPFVPVVLGETVDRTFTFAFASNSPLETGSAVANVTASGAEIWSTLKAPIVAQQEIALALGMLPTQVKIHVVTGGGSFGRHLFHDTALEAALASKAFGVPVRLMWHRTDDFRAGRVHPMATSRIQATIAGGNVVSFQQRHTSVSTDFSHSFGDQVSSLADKLGGGLTNNGLSQVVFNYTANVPYNYGITEQAINEVDTGFRTGSMRNIYSPDVCTAIELVTDELAAKLGSEPYAFRHAYLKDARSRAVLDAVAKKGSWGRTMAPGTAQGIAFHAEYKGVSACLVEIDCTPATVGRKVRDAFTGPRVTKAIFAVDVGLPVNPRGLEAQMMGGVMDGIATALTSSLHFSGGYFAEGSWDNYFYTRQWNVPPDLEIIVMPPTSGDPGGAGEFGVAAAKAAVACAYARATKTMPTLFPVNHAGPLPFDVLPTVPPIPQSPTDGLTVYS